MLTNALLAIAIAVGQAPDTTRPVGYTHRLSAATTRVIGRITDLALLGNALASVTIAITLTTDTAHAVTVIGTDGRVTTATRIRAKDAELTLIGHTLA